MRPFSRRSFYYLGMALFILLFGGNACRASNPLPLTPLNPTPQYVHFTPSDDSVFNLQFDYPAEWKSQYYEDVDWVQLNLYDPSKFPPDADLSAPIDSDNSILISVAFGDSLEDLKESVEFRLNADRNMDPERKVIPDCENCISPFNVKVVDNIILEDQATEIAGYPAHRISTQGTVVTGETRKTLFTWSVYIIGEDRLYTFDLVMLADEKDGPFGKGFEYMISTIRPYP